MKNVKSSASDQLDGLSQEEKRKLLARLLSEKKNKQSFPLSPAQQRLWFIDTLQDGQTVYLIPATLRISGTLDSALLHRCLNEIVARHEILRTSFISKEGVPRQVIAPELTLPPLEDDSDIYKKPLDLSQAPLFRARLTQEKDGSYLLHLVIHHIIADYWSLRILLRELQHLYASHKAGISPALPPLSIQYPDYAVWQNEQAGLHQSELAYWEKQLAGVPPLLRLPLDFPRPVKPSFQGRRHQLHLSESSSEELRELAFSESATLFSATLSALQALLFRYTGQDDFCIGSTVSNRDREETRHLIGLFVNNVVFRCHPEKDWSFRTWLQQTHATVVGGLSHQQVPFEQVVDILKIDRQLNHNPLFQVQFILRTGESNPPLPHNPLQLEALIPEHTTSRFDLSLELAETPDGLQGFWEYSSELFSPSTIQRMSEHLQLLLESATQNPDQAISSIPFLTEAEKQTILDWNNTALEVPSLTIPELIVHQVTKSPEAPAVTFAEKTLSYTDLNARSNQLAHYLKEKGHPTIAICMPRSEHLVVTLLAILKSGAAYLPLDPSHPQDRLETILNDAECKLCLTHGNKVYLSSQELEIIDLFEEKECLSTYSKKAPNLAIEPESLAYLIYTSGSTGRPKGVTITHQNLLNLLLSMAERPGLKSHDTWLAVTTIAFDIATLEVFLPLIVGAQIWIADETSSSDASALTHLLEQSQATIMQATPATWRLLLEGSWPNSPNLKILCGGEALDLPLAQQLLIKGQEVWNLYGPTETTIWSGALLLNHQQLKRGFVPIGGPVNNTGFHILDESKNKTPLGITGELHLSGLGLSPGYHRRKTLTEEKFFRHQGQRLYATGDLVRFHQDGTLEFLGRLDHQIKLRGFRIELGEIEKHLAAHPSVKASLVSLHGRGDNKTLIAWVLNPEGNLNASILQRALNESLPPYMVPTRIFVLESFPLNSNGKLDRRQLPLPESVSEEPQEDTLPLITPTEQTLGKIWQNLLKRPITSANTHFFEAGGHSLLVARMLARVHSEFQIDLPLRTVFDFPGLNSLAQVIDTTTQPTKPKLDRRPTKSSIELSHAQERQWVLAQLDPENSAYQIPAALKIQGPFPTEKLASALTKLCARHEVLHTNYPADETGQPRPQLSTPRDPELQILDLSHQQDNLNDELQKSAKKPFDLSQSPLLRVTLVKLAPQEHVILFVIPHLIGDAWSLRILLRDFLALIQEETLTPLPLQYSDFAYHERQQDYKNGLDYWTNQLAAPPLSIDLPRDFPHQIETSPEAKTIRFSLNLSETEALNTIARSHDATLFMTLLASLNILLHRYTGQKDLIVGSPVSHRPDPAWEEVVGMFVNTLALRTRLEPTQSFSDILTVVRQTVLTSFDHQEVPFEEIVSAIKTDRDWDRSPLFQVLFLWQADTSLSKHQNGFLLEPFALASSTAKFDLTIALARDEKGLQGRFEYRSDLFAPETITAMVEAFQLLLRKLTTEPERPIFQFALGIAPIPISYPTLSQLALHHLFEKQAGLTPEQVAIHHEAGSLTYRQLDEKSSQLAALLQERGIGPEKAVGICLNRHPDLIVAIFAVLKAGGAYLPLDPTYPTSRLAFILRDTETQIVITNQETQSALPKESKTLLISDSTTSKTPFQRHPIHSEQVAYLLYTSGSTGQPKGVTIEHRSAVALVQWARQNFSDEELRNVLASTSICFDLSIFEIFVPLSTGGSLTLVKNALDLPSSHQHQELSLINTVPSAAAELVRSKSIPSSVRTFNIAGEPLGKELVNQLYSAMLHPKAAVYNLYGPSEDTTYSTFCQTSPNENGITTPIGLPIDHTQTYLLDQYLNPVPQGMAGDLYLAGVGQARGYWNRPDLTASTFLPNPFRKDGLPLYQTGDRARLRPDGWLEFLGRSDRQVKLRGFRIELTEIEQAILRQPGISETVVALHEGILTSWLSTESSIGQLRSALAQELPGYMIPTLFVEVPALPKLPNGKVDHANLPTPQKTQGGSTTTLTTEEQKLAIIWEEILGATAIGREDNFFALGGDSILVLQVIARARQDGIIFSAKELFQNPTVAKISVLAQENKDLPTYAAIPHDQKIAAPLSPIQKWFFTLPLQHPAHWNQSLLFEIVTPLNLPHFKSALNALEQQHPALRTTFEKKSNGDYKQWYLPHRDKPPLTIISEDCQNTERRITEIASELQASFELTDGPLWKVAYLDLRTPTGPCRRLLVICHHLIIDGVSWRILLSDLQNIYQQKERTEKITFPPATSPVPQWIDYLAKEDFQSSDTEWRKIIEASKDLPIPINPPPGSTNLMGDASTVTLNLSKEETKKLLTKVPLQYRIRVEELLLTALSRTITKWTGQQGLALQLEGHGRGQQNEKIDLSRTIGWLTSLSPIVLPTHYRQEKDESLKATKEALRTLPDGGLTSEILTPLPLLRFNYLGQTDQLLGSNSIFKRASESTGIARHPKDPRDIIFEINALVTDHCLTVHWIYHPSFHPEDLLNNLLQNFLIEIQSLSDFCLQEESGAGYTASEFPQMDFQPGELDDLLSDLTEITQ